MNRHSASEFAVDRTPAIGPGSEREIPPSLAALPAGTRLAEYELLSVIGHGKSGVVYRAMDHGLQRHLAIKEYLPDALAKRMPGMEVCPRSERHAESFARGLESFVGEARLLARFDHAALVRAYRCWEANSTAYLAVPCYQGVTLGVARQAMGSPPDEPWLRGLLLPLLDALEVLHAAACYPRDLSPQNILLQPDGRPVLLDLGATRQLIGERTCSLTDLLDPAFAPVEQYTETAGSGPGPWTSLYALAALAYYCLTGREPVASTVRALDDKMQPLFEAVDRLGRRFPGLDYSVAFVSTIERALRVRAQERPRSVAEFRRGLLGGGEPGQSTRSPPAVDDPEPRVASSQWPPELDEGEPIPSVPASFDGGDVDGATAQSPEPALPEAGNQAEPKFQGAFAGELSPPFDPSLGPAPEQSIGEAQAAAGWETLGALARELDDFGKSQPPEDDAHPYDDREGPRPTGDAKLRGRGRALFMAGATVALVAVGAAGWMMWSGYRSHPKVLLYPVMPATQSARPPAAPLSLEPPSVIAPEPRATLPDESPATIANEPPSSKPPAATVAIQPEPPVASPPVPAVPIEPGTTAESAAPVPGPASTVPHPPPPDTAAPDAAPAQESPPAEFPAVAEEAPSPPPRPALVAREPDNPRVLCGPRTQFALYRCMKVECEQPKYHDHPECVYLRATDEVKAIP